MTLFQPPQPGDRRTELDDLSVKEFLLESKISSATRYFLEAEKSDRQYREAQDEGLSILYRQWASRFRRRANQRVQDVYDSLSDLED